MQLTIFSFMRLRRWLGLENLLDLCEPMKEFFNTELRRTRPEKEGNFFEKYLFEQKTNKNASR